MLSHNVYFTLADASEPAIQRQISLCNEYLEGHEGVLHFAAARRARGLERPVNDAEFHVHLGVVFSSRAQHDRYQENPRHQAFVEASQANWRTVRVFDSEG